MATFSRQATRRGHARQATISFTSSSRFEGTEEAYSRSLVFRMLHRVYFSPGMFGFGQLASYDYFAHLERALGDRLRAAGDDVETWVVDVPPTASLRRRAARLGQLVARTAEDPRISLTPFPAAAPVHFDAGPIHLVGHSTGGLDARLLASPDVDLEVAEEDLHWLPRLASVTTLSTPHFGTPLAAFFATVSGQRLLHALSALTFLVLSLGSPPLAAVSALVVAIGRLDRALGMDLRVLDRATEALLRVLDDARSREVRVYLDAIREDQGAMIQLTPEAMDLFVAAVRDRPGVLYQSTASMAPPPSLEGVLRSASTPASWLGNLTNPWAPLSATIFAAIHGVTARYDDRYPCARRDAGEQAEAMLARAFGRAPGARANDGVVPIRSQIWGKVVWAGYADHLDVLGHFRDDRTDPRARAESPPHVDWLTSGAGFDRGRFEALTDAIAAGMLESSKRLR